MPATRQAPIYQGNFANGSGVNIAKDDRGEYKLGQKRYWEHTIRDDQDFEAHVN